MQCDADGIYRIETTIWFERKDEFCAADIPCLNVSL